MPVVLQDENGPCALLALCNVLLLRGSLHFDDFDQVTAATIIAILIEAIISRAAQSGCQDISSRHDGSGAEGAIELLLQEQLLLEGLDVDVGFSSVDDFVPGPDQLLFGMLGVRLVHGWLPDVGDTGTDALSGLSYSEAVNKVVAWMDLESAHSNGVDAMDEHDGHATLLDADDCVDEEISLPAGRASKVSAAFAHLRGQQVPQAGRPSLETRQGFQRSACLVDKVPAFVEVVSERLREREIQAVSGCFAEPVNAKRRASMKLEVITELETEWIARGQPFQITGRTTGGHSPIATARHQAAHAAAEHAQSQETSSAAVATAKRGSAHERTHEVAAEGAAVKHWLDRTKSQLTARGIELLHAALGEGEIVAFFRNNHFATLTKHKGTLRSVTAPSPAFTPTPTSPQPPPLSPPGPP